MDSESSVLPSLTQTTSMSENVWLMTLSRHSSSVALLL